MKRKIFFLCAFLFLNFANSLASEVEESKVEVNKEPAPKAEVEIKIETPKNEEGFFNRYDKFPKHEKFL